MSDLEAFAQEDRLEILLGGLDEKRLVVAGLADRERGDVIAE